MRYLIGSIFIFTALTSNSQNFDKYTYDLYLFHSCDKSITKSTSYWLTKSTMDSTYSYIPDSNGTCIIPEKGMFILQTYSPEGNLKRDIDINSNRIDTLIVPPIYLSSTSQHIGPTYYYYVHCGEKCQGKYETFRETGELWQKGKFKKGHLGKLTTYFKNGQIESKKKEGLLNDIILEYDKSGKLIMDFRFFLFYSKVTIYDSTNDNYIVQGGFGHY